MHSLSRSYTTFLFLPPSRCLLHCHLLFYTPPFLLSLRFIHCFPSSPPPSISFSLSFFLSSPLSLLCYLSLLSALLSLPSFPLPLSLSQYPSSLHPMRSPGVVAFSFGVLDTPLARALAREHPSQFFNSPVSFVPANLKVLSTMALLA